MAATQLRMQHQAGSHADMVRKRGLEFLHVKVLLALEGTILPQIHPRTCSHHAVVFDVEVMRSVIPGVAKLLAPVVRLRMAGSAMHLVDVYLVPKSIDLFFLSLSRRDFDRRSSGR